MIETYIDPNGDTQVKVNPKDPKAASSKKKGMPLGSRKNSDYDIARQVVTEFGKPLAFHGGELWAFSLNTGWEIVTDCMLAKCNEAAKCNTEHTVFRILTTQMKTPNIDSVAIAATYWERKGGIWAGEWYPFFAQSNQILFANGILTVTPEGLEFEPTEKRIIYGPRVTIPFDDELLEKNCQTFSDLLDYAVPDEVERNYLQELCSLILQPHVIIRGQIVFWGEKHSGKTTLATAISCAPAGLVGASYIPENRLVMDKWASIPLVNKFANVSNDSDFTPKWEHFMKQYTGGTITVEPKFCRACSVPTTAKLISTCNEFQKLVDLSGAAAQRYKVFEFRKSLPETGSADQTQYMTPAYWCDLERRAGVVAWLINGLIRVVNNGLMEPESLKVKKQKAVGEGNPAYEWIVENLVTDKGGFVSSEEISNYLAGEGLAPHPKAVASIIKRVFGIGASRHKGKRGFLGLSVTTPHG